MTRKKIACLLSWVILLAAIVVSFRPTIPVIWGDTPPFLESALRTLEAGRPTVVGGRDPGYPGFLALTFALGGDLSTVVLIQQAIWAALMIALGATAQTLTRSPYCLAPILLVVLYPGLLIYRNVVSAEIIYAFLLNLGAFGLLLATAGSTPLRYMSAAAALIAAAAAACCKSQGFLVALLAIPLAIWMLRPKTNGQRAVLAAACVVSLGLLAAASRIGATAADRASVVFVAKTVFCNHADIVLASDAAKDEIAKAAGDNAPQILTRLAADLDTTHGTWPILGFIGDHCLFDPTLDQLLSNEGQRSYAEIANWYWRIFRIAVLDRPLHYIAKIGRQLIYGVLSAWPAQGLEPTIPVSSDDIANVTQIMRQHPSTAPASQLRDESVRTWIVSDLGPVAVYLFKGLSVAFAASIIFFMAALAFWRGPYFSRQAGVLIALWLASILGSAAAHTLDVTRYLIPSTPMVALLLSITTMEFARMALAHRRRG